MKRREMLFVTLLVLLTALVYFPALEHELIWDAKPLIRENALLQGDFSLTAPFRSGYWASTSQRGSGYDYYRPLMILSFMAEKAAWGLSPFRLTMLNLILFIVGLIVLYLLLRRQPARPGTARIAVLLFALFPLHVDNIVWAAGRCDVLMLLFGLLAIYAFDIFLEKGNSWHGAAAVGAYVLALFSKEASLFFLPVFILLELQRRRRLTMAFHAPLWVASILFWLLKSAVIGRGGIPMRLFPTLWENAGTVLGVLGYYARSLAFPFRYDMFLPVNAVQTAPYVAAGLLFLALLLACPWLWRKQPQVGFAWAWVTPFTAGYLMMVFTPIYPFSISTRYLMVPAIGLAWILAHGLSRLPSLWRHAVVTVLVFASALAVIGNSRKYRSETDFWKSAMDSSPNESFFLNKYAGELRREGDFIRGDILLRRALSGKMKSPTAISIALQLAEAAFEKARYPESLDWLEKISTLPMDPPHARLRLGQHLKIRLAQGDLHEAEKAMRAMAGALPDAQAGPMRVEMYLAFADWEKAREAARTLGGLQAAEQLAMIRKLQAVFAALPAGGQAGYFLERGSFTKAWELWPKADAPGVAGQLQAARLAFLAGLEHEGKRRVESIARAGAADFRILNSAGNLYFELHRAEQALPLYRRSLQLNPAQPALRERVRWID